MATPAPNPQDDRRPPLRLAAATDGVRLRGASPLVGRSRELWAFEETLQAVDEGGARVLGVRGEPGIGKSRLLGELARRAAARGHLVLEGRATELERDVPYALLVDALDDELDRRADDLEAILAPLGAVLPAATRATGGAAPTDRGDRHRAARAVRSLLETLARDRPVTLLLDDVQWADPASAEVLGLLVHRLPRAPALIVYATRVHGAARLDAALQAAARAASGVELELGPLGPEAADALLPELSRGARARLYAKSGGNPFYLESLARVCGTASAEREHGAAGGVPRAVMAVLAHEVSQLAPAARRMLEGAAVVGDPFELDLAAAAADAGGSAALDALDAVVGADLVRPTDEPRRFRFRHPLVRHAVYEGAAAGWRLGAHGRVAQALAARGAGPVELAHHVERAASTGDLEAVELLAAAAADVCGRAPASAASWLAAALRLLPDAPRHYHRRTQLMGARARALTATGQVVEARDALTAALVRLGEGTPDHVETSAALGHIEVWLGRPQQARRVLLDARAGLRRRDTREWAALTLELALERNCCGDHKPSLAFALEAAAAAGAAGAEAMAAEAAALAALAATLALRGVDAHALRRADERLETARRRAAALPDDRLAERPATLVWLTLAELFTGRHADAAATADRGLALARRTGEGLFVGPLLCFKGEAAVERGDLQTASALAEDGLERALLSGNSHTQYWGAMLAALVAIARGRVEEAVAQAQAGADAVAVPPSSAGVTLAAARLAAGEPNGAADALAAFDGIDPRMSPRDRVRAVELSVRIALARGRVEEAETLARRAPVEAGGRRGGIFGAMIGRVDALVLLAHGVAGAAAEAALRGAAAADAVAAPIEAARCRTLAGEALAAAGRRDAARAELRRAVSALEALGADGHRGEALRALRRLGDRPRPATGGGSGPGSDGSAPGRLAALTAREREVAALAAGGRTNRQIGAQLHLSHKTVEKHVAAALAKLRVPSRAALAHALAAEAPARGAA